MNTKIVPISEALTALRAAGKNIPGPGSFGVWFGMLFAGDRSTCCDEAAIMEVDGTLASVATISSNGEMDSGEPTIVGLYTLPQFRGQGFGKAVMEVAIRRCLARGFHKIRVDALTKGAIQVIASLPEELQNALVIHDQSNFGSLLPQ
ncbi:MAG TPA: GNAT family N-acetyltransferase [Candidatus Paceibacterota bacterium]|jgi:GNAT superfamily N-acetyltransferase|nr:GNAT family N-acetyltransferase [Candidatus Paceibacterota bacterium]